MNIAFIPVRCGSKGIKNKNIKLFCGRPLVFWCLDALHKCKEIDEVFVATDCDEIEKVVSEFRMPKVRIYRRDEENATSTASTESAMLEFISKNEFDENDNFILVQATNPFVKHTDFTKALKSMNAEGFDSMLTCCRIKRFVWSEDGTPLNYDYKNRPLRQFFDGLIVENGAFYINSIKNILKEENRLSGKIGIYEMPEYSFTEIDEVEDWIIAERIFLKHYPQHQSKKKIKMLLTDVDGVLTDAGMYYSENGDELKKFSTYDGMAFGILNQQGIKTGMITSEDRNLNVKRAKKLKMDFVFQGVKEKLKVLQQICESTGIAKDEVAYIGDDINDFDILSQVGIAACPSTAMQKIKDIPGIIVLNARGGEGVIRELLEDYIEI